MSRYVIFGGAEVSLVAAPAADASTDATAAATVTKIDVVPVYNGYDSEGNFNFTVPAYDDATYNVLNAIHVSLYEVPNVPPTDPNVIVTAALHYSTAAASPATAAQSIVVDATSAYLGDYTAVFVAEFAE